MQPEAFGQLAAHLRIAELDVAVGNGLPVITYAIVDQMAMGMGLVEVPHQKVLRIGVPIFSWYSRAFVSSARRVVPGLLPAKT